ncbi:MAG: hypothetical protein LUD68_10465, partial [Rikenellaceae bacterium]|nr:hypothetical protein [Rikenellaceae bacterium]
MKKLLVLLAAGAVVSCSSEEENTSIDRQALVTRNNIRVEKLDPLASVSVGNGRFAFTVDGTGLQTFPDFYHPGVPLGTFSEWGWHAFPNPENLTHDETLRNYNFRGWEEPYSIEYKDGSRNAEASKWFRVNPHRMHLGYLGLELTDSSGNPVAPEALGSIAQITDLWNGNIESSFTVGDTFVEVQTACSPEQDLIAARVKSPGLTAGNVKLNLRFGYPTGGHSDNATDWSQPEKHSTKIVEQGDNFAILERKLDETTYYVKAQWSGNASLSEKQAHYFVLSPESDEVSVSVLYTDEKPSTQALTAFPDVLQAASGHWQDFWMSGAAVDFSACTDPRAAELERRVVLSQYLTAIQNTQGVPPAESGLTYNTWFGRPHLEMHWWHGVHFPLWGRDNLLEKSLAWYENAAFEGARKIAERQQFDGVRWMKMTDNWANEAPSSVGSFLIWQQPHIIYFAELLYRNNPSPVVLEKYKDVVLETAKFMGSFP